MKNFSLIQAGRALARGISNYRRNRPLCVSFEVTLSCNANCRHCDVGGIRKGEDRLEPLEYARLASLLRPPVVQISGGEPLLREDVVEIIRAIKLPNGLPYIIFVTNGALLNEDKYLELKRAGINQFSVSLDFPDERHDEFRRFRGLYAHLEKTIPRLAELGYHDIVLNSAITRDNLKCLLALAQRAQQWKVSISYSAYSMLRTGCKDHFIFADEELGYLLKSIGDLITLKRENGGVVNSELTLNNTYEFFKKGFLPNCGAGKRFLVVMPDGHLNPCAHHRKRYSTQQQMIEEFSNQNTCGGCYVSIRAYTDQSIWNLLTDSVSAFMRRK
jgi:MoaA/NifB/PqqE/SkfB family radical SAM enzyme